MFSSFSDNLTVDVNDWFFKKTGGNIAYAVDDMSGTSSALVGSLYMNAMWISVFPKSTSYRDVFTGIDGRESEMEFMEQTGEFSYAEENGTKLLLLPLKDNLSLVCFSGTRMNMFDKLPALKKQTVHVAISKIEIAYSVDTADMLNFLISKGVTDAFNRSASDFGNMCDDPNWVLQDNVQTAKLTVDETGIETSYFRTVCTDPKSMK